MKKDMFDVNEFNIIQDEENYYFFRALNMGDNKDIETGVILDKNGNFTRIRTDRERYEEDPEKGTPKYDKDSGISLEQVYDHIKMHYRKDTNCISLSSNANVSKVYGANYKNQYVLVKVPKKEMGTRVFNAGEYMLEEIEKRVNEAISSIELPADIKADLDKIDKAVNDDELKEIIKNRYTSKEQIKLDRRAKRERIIIKSPHARISNYQSLNEEQSLEKNKIIAKLTILEDKKIMEPIIKNSANNKLLIQTIGNAFSSSEQIHYGDIQSEKIIDVQEEIVDIFSLIQQVDVPDKEIIEKLKRDVIDFINQGKKIEIPEDSILRRQDKVKDDITIEEMYEITQGNVEYGKANSIVKNMFYLTRARANAKEIARILNEITSNKPEYEEIIKYIADNGFKIEPEIITRRSNIGVQISESVNLDLKNEDVELIDEIKELTEEEQIEILENGGLSNTRNIINKTFSKVKNEKQISREDYYASAIIDSYNWQEIEVEELTISQRNELIKRIKEKDCIKIYNRLQEAGVKEQDIPRCALNMAMKGQFSELLENENSRELIQESIIDLNQKPSIEQIETFLGYYSVENTGIVLRDYQRNAVDKADDIFDEKRFASIVLPTGAGKTFVALTELTQHKDEQILYLAPQEEILEQTKDRIIEYIHGKRETFGKSKDEIIAEVFPNIKFETYTGLTAKRGKETIENQYGFIVMDELHRTGAKEWGVKLDELLENQNENTKVLGITATPVRDMDDRNMADEMAMKLGYTKEEVKQRKHIAEEMDLVQAIKLGLVVNPKIINCEYTLKTDGSMENLLESINEIEDEEVRKEKIQKYEKLRRSLDNAEGIPEILQENIKPNGKYIVFIPVTEKNYELEDEDGNENSEESKKTAIDKVKEYEEYLQKCFENTGINPKCYSMLGEYYKEKNQKQLEQFENDNIEEPKFMIVMNKANEGLHIKGIDGIVWFRPLDENSKILYLQQLGRAIYGEDPNNPTKDEDRPMIFDFANNTMKVNLDKELKTSNGRDDFELLSIVVDWVNEHDNLPNIDSSSKKEQRYAATLYRIQNKYMKYLNGFEEYEDLTEEKINQIKDILQKGAEIDLWDIELEIQTIEKVEKILDVEDFEVKGILKDFVELKNEVNESESRTSVEKFIEKLQKLQEIGVDVSKIEVKDTIQTLAKKSGIDEERIKEIGLKAEDKIGISKSAIAQAHRGKGQYTKPTDDQVKILLEMGISLEKQERNATQEFIEKLQKLQEIGVDVSKIVDRDTIQTLAKKSGISEDRIKEIGLEPKDKIGNSKNNIAKAHRGKGSNTPPTDDQVKILLEMGISLEKQERNATQEFIEKLQKLQEIGVDVSKIKRIDTIETLVKNAGISEDRIKEIGLEPKDKIGNSKTNISQAYRGKGNYTPPTDDQVKILLEMGISLDKKSKTGQEIGQASFDSNVEMCDQAQEVLGTLVEKIKEGGIMHGVD